MPAVNSRRNAAANRPPPQRIQSCWDRSAILLLWIRSAIASGIGIGHCSSPAVAGRGEHVVDDLLGAHHAGDPVAERDDHVAGQGGDVEDHVGLLLGRADQRVGQDQPALGVGVEDLDRGAAVHA